MKRREFLQRTAQVGVAAWTAASASRVYGANNRVNVGLIGCGGRGTFDARLMRGTPDDIKAVAPANYHDGNLDSRLREPRNVEIAALCDVYGSRMDRAKEWAPNAKTYNDFRELLEQKDVDAVIVATMDDWHAVMTILACDAGKDVYCEKPMMFRVHEGQAMIDAARRNNRIVFAGTQHRSSDHIAQAAEMVQSGKIGPVRFVRVWNSMGSMGNRPLSPDSEPPADLDWDRWLGPAPKVPFNQDRLNYRRWMDYNNGLISDYGNHRFDSVHQIMGVDTPLTVSSSGAKYDNNRAGDIPDVQQATYEYDGFIMSYECNTMNGHGLGRTTEGMNYYGARGPENRPHGMAFYGTEAALFVDRLTLELYSEPKPRQSGNRGSVDWEPRMEKVKVNEDEPTPLHTKIFVDHVRSRKTPFADIEPGVMATTVPLIGNVAMWTGRKLKWDAKTKTFVGDKEADKYLFRKYREPYQYGVKFV